MIPRAGHDSALTQAELSQTSKLNMEHHFILHLRLGLP
jgi:hypothetical protein